MKIKEAYYFLYYTLYRAWSKNDNPFLSDGFRADVCLMALKIWIFMTINAYLSILLNIKSKLAFTDIRAIAPIVVAIGTTLYFSHFRMSGSHIPKYLIIGLEEKDEQGI